MPSHASTQPAPAPAPEGSAAALLVLEDGRTFTGRSYGAVGQTVGEAVFATGMTGYQETLTDPSYDRQVVVQTAPHIGNTGWTADDDESTRIWVAGYVVRDPTRAGSSWRSRRELADVLTEQGVVGISGVDTRALTRHLRSRGAMRAGVFSGPPAARPLPELLDVVRAAPPMAGAALAGEVSTERAYVVPAVGERRFVVAALDLGVKSMSPHRMAERGIEVHVLPAGASFADIAALPGVGPAARERGGPDGVFYSNGPGDPASADEQVEVLRQVLAAGTPYFGICFGNQLLGRALGLSTYKLRYGHRGINQPVLDRATGRVEITAHNHGFAIAWPGHEPSHPVLDACLDRAVDTPFGPVRVSHVALNDGVVEGLRLAGRPVSSVQYHPEAAAGPHDAGYLFDRFVTVMSGSSATADQPGRER